MQWGYILYIVETELEIQGGGLQTGNTYISASIYNL